MISEDKEHIEADFMEVREIMKSIDDENVTLKINIDVINESIQMIHEEKERFEADLSATKENMKKVNDEKNAFETDLHQMRTETVELNDEFSKYKDDIFKRNEDFCIIIELMVDDLNELKQRLPKPKFFKSKNDTALQEIINRLHSKLETDINRCLET